MQIAKKIADYIIYKRGDGRYAVKANRVANVGKDNKKGFVNGDEKVKILLEQGLLTTPAAPSSTAESQIAGEVDAD